MSAYLLAVSLPVPGPVQKLSARAPLAEWVGHIAGSKWLVQPPLALTGGAGQHPPRGASLRPLSSGPAGRGIDIVDQSRAERRLLESLNRWDAVPLQPVVWLGGRLQLRLLAPDSRPPASWVARFPGTDLILRRQARPSDLAAGASGLGQTLNALTSRQRTILAVAVREGYYEVPRRTTVARVAAIVGIGRSTAEEHLRAAESMVVGGLAPLYLSGDAGPGEPASAEELTWFAQFSSELDLYLRMALRGDRIERVVLSRRSPKRGIPRHHPYLDRMVDHVHTGRDDLLDLPVNLSVPGFDREVLEAVRRIPPGQTATYGEIATRLGRPRAARAVGNALARNPALVVVPCHRVVPALGGYGNYSGEGGARTKERLLRQERRRRTEPAG